MIEGLKIRVTAEELACHLKNRAAYHRTRADKKEAELPALKSAADKVKADLQPASLTHMNKGTSSYSADVDNLVEQMESDIRTHRNKALAFDYFAGHLFAEDYTLQENDLKRLEILASF